MGEFDIAKRMRNTKIVLPTAPQVLHLKALRPRYSMRPAVYRGLDCTIMEEHIPAEVHLIEYGHEDAWLV